ncbi:uncharacterized protein LOC110383781 [Helicoverpa armigera]|uniref:uncharacterized protein LOC110383781 n=1 Tax=Helicoverpa armigera TaxID=29058 RepID=UPI001F59687E|nr:uncharacterized protein LOC110383781 [Helicoverpa armigera]XP_047020749.1 uncharacterized protein LOC124630781 isoform X2 [Helicoverpa zea]
MADEPECQLRRRKVSGNPNLPLNLDVEYLVSDGDPDQGTPSPSNVRRLSHQKQKSSSSALLDYKNKQQSFDIQVEECEEEEIIIESEDDDEDNAEGGDDRSITPTPIQDFGANVVYTEGPQATDFLRVKAMEAECYTDVSDADTDEEGN